LKKSQEEKELVECALRDSKKDHEKSSKTKEEDLKMIENLRKDADKSTKTMDELHITNTKLAAKNAELAKTLSTKEQAILRLEKDLSERSETLNKGTDEIRECLKLLC
jgi:septal ring factor EnvC (AmiA/AmiB activator)